MRRLFVVMLCLVGSTAFAQQKNGFSVFLGEAQVTSNSASGTRFRASYGLTFNRMVTPRISAELSVASEDHDLVVVTPNGSSGEVSRVGFRTRPIDVAARYHFFTDRRWTPYIGIGARYVAAPHVSSDVRYQTHFGPEIVGGTIFRINRSLGLAFDGRLYLGDRERDDGKWKPSVGLIWRW